MKFGQKSLYNHPEITSEVYTYAILAAGLINVQSSVFKWLLATASHDELLAVKSRNYYLELDEDFRAAVDQAFSTVKLGKARLGVIGPKAEAVKQLFMEDFRGVSIPEAVVNIIRSYVTEGAGSDGIKREWNQEDVFRLEPILMSMQRKEQESRQAREEELGRDQGRRETDEDYDIESSQVRRTMAQTRDAENVVEERVVEQPRARAIQQLPETVQTEEVAQVQAVEEGLALIQEQSQSARQSRRSRKKGGEGKKSKAKTGAKTKAK